MPFGGNEIPRSYRSAMSAKVPNILTMMRIAVIPVVCGLVFVPASYAGWISLGVYAYACVTDFFDGYLARALNVRSRLGRMLDPIADKLLVGGIILTLVAVDRLTDWNLVPAAIILFREILVSGLREFLAEVRVSMPVSKLAKWKTAIQMVCLGFLLVGPAGPDFGPLTTTRIGLGLLWIAATLTAITGYDYLRVGLRHARQENGEDPPDVRRHIDPDVSMRWETEKGPASQN